MSKALHDLVYSRTDGAMAARTAIEALLGWFLANLPEILNLFSMSDAVKGLISSLIMVIISWALGVLRKNKDLVVDDYDPSNYLS